MKCEPDHFGEEELALIYVAKKLKEALRLEQLLTESGIDYLVEPDKFVGGVMFKSERIGAFFYVAPANIGVAQEAMKRGGFEPYRTD